MGAGKLSLRMPAARRQLRRCHLGLRRAARGRVPRRPAGGALAALRCWHTSPSQHQMVLVELGQCLVRKLPRSRLQQRRQSSPAHRAAAPGPRGRRGSVFRGPITNSRGGVLPARSRSRSPAMYFSIASLRGRKLLGCLLGVSK